LRIEHTTLSREHARFDLTDDQVIVEDLGSKNGVLLDGQRVQRAALDVGVAVTLGAGRIQVQALGLAPQAPGLDDEGPFRQRVEEELVRAAQFRRPFGLLFLRAIDPPGRAGSSPRGTAWIEEVRSGLRSVDRFVLYGPSAIQILLPEMGL